MARKRTPEPEASRTPVASLGRGMQVLETLASIPARGSLPELIKQTGLDRATVNRLLRSLLDTGYVERTGRGEYAVSTRGYLLGVHLTQSHNLVRVAQPALRALRD